MFNSEGLQAWLERNQIPETTRTVINAIAHITPFAQGWRRFLQRLWPLSQ